MNKWGIGLLIVATLANAGILYLALDNRSKRHDIQNAIVRHELALQGLPVDGAKIDGSSVDMKISGANGVTIDGTTTDNFIKYLDAQGGAQFGSTPGSVANQVDEVNRVVGVVNTTVAPMTPKQKVDFLVGSFANTQRGRTFIPGILIYLAQTAEEREAARALAITPNSANATKAVELFTTKATAATAPGAPDGVRRQAIAHFLSALEPTSDDWQKRVAQVVGLRSYLKAVAEQDLSFQEIASRVERRIEDDQGAFVAQYQQLMHLSIQRSLLLSRETAILKDLDDQQKQDAEALGAKQTQKAKSSKTLDDLQRAVTVQSSSNADLETAMHATQRTVGRMLDAILKLEADLDAAEQQRKGR